MKSLRISCAFSIAAALLTASTFASAQPPPPRPRPAPPRAEAALQEAPSPAEAPAVAAEPAEPAAPPEAEPIAPPPPPPPPVAGPAPADAADSESESIPDIDRWILRFGVTYHGVARVPLSSGTDNGQKTVLAPVIGVRYWMGASWGLDLGLGLGVASGSTENFVSNQSNQIRTTDKSTELAVAVHAGVPLIFARGKHYAFQLVPQLTVAYARATDRPQVAGGNQSDIDRAGNLIQLGSRVGAEIFFGFIGVPELSLQASVGLFFRREYVGYTQQTPSSNGSDSNWGFGTTVQAEPWAIFANNIAATYYF